MASANPQFSEKTGMTLNQYLRENPSIDREHPEMRGSADPLKPTGPTNLNQPTPMAYPNDPAKFSTFSSNPAKVDEANNQFLNNPAIQRFGASKQAQEQYGPGAKVDDSGNVIRNMSSPNQGILGSLGSAIANGTGLFSAYSKAQENPPFKSLSPIAQPTASPTPQGAFNVGNVSIEKPNPNFGKLSPIAQPPSLSVTQSNGLVNGNSGFGSAFTPNSYTPLGAPNTPLKLPEGVTITPNAGISNGLVAPEATPGMKITPLNGISNGMPAPNSAVTAPAPKQFEMPSAEEMARFRKETGTRFNPKSINDKLSIERMRGGEETFDTKQANAYRKANPDYAPGKYTRE